MGKGIHLEALGFPGGSAGKESTCNEGDLGLIPALGRSLGVWKGYPLQYSGLENSKDCIVHGVATVRHNWVTFTLFMYKETEAQRDEVICNDYKVGTRSSSFIGDFGSRLMVFLSTPSFIIMSDFSPYGQSLQHPGLVSLTSTPLSSSFTSLQQLFPKVTPWSLFLNALTPIITKV